MLTGDDKGRGKNEQKLRPRARQNVILELGYFIGKLGRDGVAVLYEKGVEPPSDYRGVEYIEVDDAGAWKMKLCREIDAAGIDVEFRNIS